MFVMPLYLIDLHCSRTECARSCATPAHPSPFGGQEIAAGWLSSGHGPDGLGLDYFCSIFLGISKLNVFIRLVDTGLGRP
jgi:hypothetical protein